MRDGSWCPIDGSVEFSGKMDGGWEVEEHCPECGAELEIRKRLVIKMDLENAPEPFKEEFDQNSGQVITD